MHFGEYEAGAFYDEMFAADRVARPEARALVEFINTLPEGELSRRQAAAERALLHMGITFNVYGDGAGTERIFPFDLVPRIVSAREWQRLERGLKQRIRALNLFIHDVYHKQQILRDGVVPRELVMSATSHREACEGLRPPHGIWCHITGTDLVRDKDGQFYVLEDNLRCPSGVSYVLQNRQLVKRTFPQLFEASRIRPVDDYASRLRDMLEYLSPEGVERPRVVLLTPGPYNSAYFEHSFLAQQMGVELVEGRDLVVRDGYVWMRSTHGLQKVDVIYRRMDDDFLDPTVFRADSVLGVPGLFDVYRRGHVALANAPGTGIADDKAVYSYVPQIVKYYLDEDPILPNVPTFVCDRPAECQHVLEHLDALPGVGLFELRLGETSLELLALAFACRQLLARRLRFGLRLREARMRGLEAKRQYVALAGQGDRLALHRLDERVHLGELRDRRSVFFARSGVLPARTVEFGFEIADAPVGAQKVGLEVFDTRLAVAHKSVEMIYLRLQRAVIVAQRAGCLARRRGGRLG